MKIPSKNCRLPIADCRLPVGKSRRASFRKIANRQSPIVNSRAGFTMIEIALCLAIIGFAVVAIIGVLPMGMNVQKDNREETIINQDAVVWMNSLRNGAQGFNDLTNYVTAITNYWKRYEVIYDATTSTYTTNVVGPDFDGYTRTGSRVSSVLPVLAPDVMSLTNGTRIIGLLSTPKYFPNPPAPGFGGTFQSNYVIAYVRAMSGSAVEKPPQNNDVVLENAFTYRLVAESSPYVPVDPATIDLSAAAIAGLANAQQRVDHTNWAHTVQILQTNSHDLRLMFRWPLLPTGEFGNNRVTFRAFTGGWLFPTFDFYVDKQPLFFFQPATYVP